MYRAETSRILQTYLFFLYKITNLLANHFFLAATIQILIQYGDRGKFTNERVCLIHLVENAPPFFLQIFWRHFTLKMDQLDRMALV